MENVRPTKTGMTMRAEDQIGGVHFTSMIISGRSRECRYFLDEVANVATCFIQHGRILGQVSSICENEAGTLRLDV